MSPDTYWLMFRVFFFLGGFVVIFLCLWVMVARYVERKELRAKGWLQVPGNLWRQPHDPVAHTQQTAAELQLRLDRKARQARLVGKRPKPGDFFVE